MWGEDGHKSSENLWNEGSLEKMTVWSKSGQKDSEVTLDWKTINGQRVCSGTFRSWAENGRMMFEGIIQDRYYIKWTSWHTTTGNERAAIGCVFAKTLPATSPHPDRGGEGTVINGPMAVWYEDGKECAEVNWNNG